MHLIEVCFGDLSHRVIELELLDRAQHERFLALHRHASPSADGDRGLDLFRDQRQQDPVRAEPHEADRHHSQAEDDDVGWRLPSSDDYRGRCGKHAAEQEELPGL